jgi:hypothetical protein
VSREKFAPIQQSFDDGLEIEQGIVKFNKLIAIDAGKGKEENGETCSLKRGQESSSNFKSRRYGINGIPWPVPERKCFQPFFYD